MRILWDNLWSRSGTLITATSEASALPAAASQSPDRTYVWRSLSQAADQALTADLGAAALADSVAIANLRRQGGGDLKLYEGGSGGSPGTWNLVATLPSAGDEGRVSLAVFSAVTARHWKLQWRNAAAPGADYAEAGYIHLGPHWNFTGPAGFPAHVGIDPSLRRDSVDGQANFALRTAYSTGQIDAVLDEMQLSTLRNIRRQIGQRTPFFLERAAAYPWMVWLVRFLSEIAYERIPGTNPTKYRASFEWEEVR